MSEPIDQHQRTRLLTEMDRTLFVEAGAGSGKTTQLVHRVVQLLVTGTLPDISALAAITFTEAAAAELRDRIREELERAVGTEAVGSVRRSRIEDALDHVDDAAISTLHGFAHRILAGFPIEAGLPPGFEVADEIAAAVTEREQWDEFLDALFADDGFEPILRRAFTLGLTMRQLTVVAHEFAENWDRLELLGAGIAEQAGSDPGSVTLAPLDIEPVLDTLDGAVVWAGDCGGSAKSVQTMRDVFGPFLHRLEDEPDPEAQLLLLLHELPTFPTMGNVTKPELVELRRLVDAARDAIGALLDRSRLEALTPILGRIASFTLAMADRRRQEGQVRFHDLLVLARRMLVAHASVRRELGRQFRLLLIDEFQDTDPLQIEIALLLALADPDVTPTSWQDAVVEEGRLFFVGDPKQSIYRFRRADISVFEQVRDRFSHHGAVELTVNFRTVPSLLAWVNDVFDRLIGPDAQEGQPRYLPLAPSRPDLDGDAPVVVLGGPIAARSVAEVRERESRELAAAISLMKDEGWLVHPKGDAAPRPVQFRDVTVLIPSRQVLSELERSLERQGVPYRVESRSLVFGTDEVRELLAILQAVDDPGDEVAVLAALRSPAFACSDADLARYRAAVPSSRRWDYTRPAAAETRQALGSDDPVLAALAALHRLHDERMWMPVHELVEQVIRDRHLVELTTARRRPRDHWRRLRMVLDEARAFVEAGGVALADFVAHIEQQADEKATRVETVVSEPDDDAVRILTIHGSKGLEFPVVVLAGLGIEYRAPHNRVLWTDDGPEIALGSQDKERFETPGYAARRDHEELLDRYERERLLYVGATRARDHLVVSLYHRPGRDCAARRISDLLDEFSAAGVTRHRVIDPAVLDAQTARAATPARRPAPELGASPDPAAADTTAIGAAGRAAIDLDDWRRRRTDLLARAARVGAIAPTGLARRALADVADMTSTADATGTMGTTGPRDATGENAITAGDATGASHATGENAPAAVERDREAPEHRFGARGQGGTAMGRAVHGALQVLDLADPANLEALARHQAAAEGVADRAGAVEKLVRSALASPSVQEAVASGRYWRELFVSAPLGVQGTIIEGYVDLLYENAQGELIVVDYKTDAGSEDVLGASADRYRLQGAAYAAMLEVALGRPVARCVFVFARSGPAVERPITDLRAAIADVVAAVDGP